MLPPFFYSARSRASLLSFPTRRSSDLAGAEAVEVSGHRLVASSAFVDGPDGVAVDGNPIGTQMEWRAIGDPDTMRSEEHTSELQSRGHLVCRLLLEKKKRLLYPR